MKDILKIIQGALESSIHNVIKEKLGGYNSPLEPIIKKVIDTHEARIRCLLNEACENAVTNEDFKENLKKTFNDKLCKLLCSKLDGEIEKRVNELRGSPEFRAKLTLAITNVLNETQKQKA